MKYNCHNLWFFFAHSLRYDKQMQQITPSSSLRTSSFPNCCNKLLTKRHIHCAHLCCRCSWFSAFHVMANVVGTWALTFPGRRILNKVTYPISMQAWARILSPCSFHWHQGVQEGLRHVLQKELLHTFSRAHTWPARWSCSWDTPSAPDLM